MLKISNGKVKRAQRVVVYGAEGIGKTTLASQFPEPLFIDTEGGTAHIDVNRIDGVTNWGQLIAVVNVVAQQRGICKTLVIDTADKAEQWCIKAVLEELNVSGIESVPYGKGYTYIGEKFAGLLTACDKVIDAGINVVITAHAKMRKFEQPDESGSYDRWELKLTRQSAPLLKEWCDLLLFCNYKTMVVQSENKMEKAKVRGGKRVMYTSHHPCWDAKNRHGLPEELPLDYSAIARIFTDFEESLTIAKENALERLNDMMSEAGVTAEEVQAIVASRGHYDADTVVTDYHPEFIAGWLTKHWPKVVDLIKQNREQEESSNG